MQAFTTIEILVVIIITTILLLIAVPNFSQLLVNNKAISETNKLVNALQLTRSIAITKKINTKFCKSNDHKTCSGNWQDGQIIIAENKVIRVYPALKQNDKLFWNSSLDRNDFIEFTDEGFTSGQAGSFIYCSNGKAEFARVITINQTGRIKVSTSLTENQKRLCKVFS